MGLRRLARQLKAGRRKAALALGYAAYVEAETQAGRKHVGKRAWRETLAGPSTLRVASEWRDGGGAGCAAGRAWSS